MPVSPERAAEILESNEFNMQSLQVGSTYSLDGQDVILMCVAAWHGSNLDDSVNLHTDKYGNGRISDKNQRNYTKRYSVEYVGDPGYEILDESTGDRRLNKAQAMAVYRVLGVMKDGGFLHRFITSDEFEIEATRKKHVSDTPAVHARVEVPKLTEAEALAMAKQRLTLAESKKADGLPGM